MRDQRLGRTRDITDLLLAFFCIKAIAGQLTELDRILDVADLIPQQTRSVKRDLLQKQAL